MVDFQTTIPGVKARGSSDVHVLFSSCNGCNGLEVVIGGWGNQYSTIRQYKQEKTSLRFWEKVG